MGRRGHNLYLNLYLKRCGDCFLPSWIFVFDLSLDTIADFHLQIPIRYGILGGEMRTNHGSPASSDRHRPRLDAVQRHLFQGRIPLRFPSFLLLHLSRLFLFPFVFLLEIKSLSMNGKTSDFIEPSFAF